MSVTFTCPEAPAAMVPCEWCRGALHSGTAIPNAYGGYCDPYCRGIVVVSEAPEVNFANGNAAAILDLLGLVSGDLCGRVDEADLPDLQRSIVRAMNRDRSHLLRESFELPGGHAGVVVVHDADGIAHIERRGCRVIVNGTTDEQTMRRLRALVDLVVWAQEHRCSVTWG